MRSLLRTIRQFLSELRRRNVYQVAVTYVVVGFFVIEGADLTLTRLGLPPWTVTFVIVVVGLGFPIALVLAWALEMTPEGVRVDESVAEETEGSEELPAPASTTRDLWIGGSVLVLLLLGAWWMWASLGGSGIDDQVEGQSPDIDERSIAVLPFEAHGQEESGPFTEGIHDDLLTRLSKISALKVISRTSVERYRDTELSLPAIADSLGVRWIMEGSVLEAGGQIRVNAQLIDPTSDTHVWAEDYRRALTTENLFAIQGEITREIADALQATLTAGEQKRVGWRPTEDLEAYRIYVQGRTYLDQRTEAGIHRGMEHFRRAIRQDSTYALAWAGLSDALSLLHFYGYVTADSALAHSLKAARRALELDPNLADAHVSMGILRSLRQEGPSALRHLKRAVELKPSYGEAYTWLGWMHLLLGTPTKALKPARRSVEYDPLAPAYRAYLAEAYLANGREQDALKEARRARELQPEYGLAHFMEGLVLHHLGRYAEAGSALSRSRSFAQPGGTPRPPEVEAVLAASQAAAGDSAAARKRLAGIDSEKAPFSKGLAHAALGNVDKAFATFRRVQVWGSFSTEHLRYFFPEVLGPLRKDPRYETLIRNVNRSWSLNPDGSLPKDTEVATDLQSDA